MRMSQSGKTSFDSREGFLLTVFFVIDGSCASPGTL